MQMFFSKYDATQLDVESMDTKDSLQSHMWIFNCLGVGTPNAQPVQGSTVFHFLYFLRLNGAVSLVGLKSARLPSVDSPAPHSSCHMEEAEYFGCYFCKTDEAQSACTSDWLRAAEALANLWKAYNIGMD